MREYQRFPLSMWTPSDDQMGGHNCAIFLRAVTQQITWDLAISAISFYIKCLIKINRGCSFILNCFGLRQANTSTYERLEGWGPPPPESFPRWVMGLTMLVKNLALKVKNTLALHKACESGVGITIRTRFLTYNRRTSVEEPSKRQQKCLDKNNPQYWSWLLKCLSSPKSSHIPTTT